MKKTVLKKILKILILLFAFLSGLLFLTVVWLIRTWSELSASEIIFHLTQSLEGTNQEMVMSYLFKYLLPALIAMGAAIAVALYAHKKAKAKVVYLIYLVGTLMLFLASGILMEKKFGMFTYLRTYILATSGKGEDFIGDNYVSPEKVKLNFPDKKRNLIFIYLESFEMTFADKENGGAFEENVIPELTALAKEGEDFSGGDTLEGGVSLYGSDWTMGAMFAQTSGLPLQVSIGGNRMAEETEFFPDLVSLGDILEDEGYNQVLLLGSKASFGGRDKYFGDHGKYQQHDYDWAIENKLIPSDYHVWWGYEDEKLFDIAKDDITALASEGKPFNYSMLTVDTHFENGYVCRLCDEKFGDNQYANVFACSSRQVSEFVEWIKKQPFYENTTVIISGDHPTMDKNFCDDVDPSYQRRTLFSILNAPKNPQNTTDRKYTTMDIFPTTLSAMGVDIEGGRLGLGTDLFSGEETLLEKYGIDQLGEEMGKPSAFMTRLSHVVITTDTLDNIQNTGIKVNGNDKGNLNIALPKVRSIKMSSLIKAELEVEIKSTGEVKKYDMKVKPVKNDPNQFSIRAVTDIPESKKGDIVVRIYFTVQGINHYKVYEWTEE